MISLSEVFVQNNFRSQKMFVATLFLVLDCHLNLQEIEKMGDSKFHVRKAAFIKLEKMGEKSFIYLKIGQNHKDREISSRCEVLIKRFYCTIRPSNYAFLPWISELPENYPYRREIIDQYLVNGGCDKNNWCGFRMATFNFVCHLYDKGTPVSVIVELLNKMAVAEKQWCNNHRYVSKGECYGHYDYMLQEE